MFLDYCYYDRRYMDLNRTFTFKKMIKLNLGCQIHYIEGWINQDIVGDDPNIRIDINCDADKLPLEDNSVDFIYAGHLIEHLYPDTVQRYLQEWFRVLKHGGKVVIVTPDSGKHFKLYSEGKLTIEHLLQPVYGRIYSYDSLPERHHMLFDWQTLFDTISLVPFGNIWKMDFNHPPEELVPLMDNYISRSDMQVGIIAEK